MWYVCNVLLQGCISVSANFVVRGCAVSRRYINVCNCDMFSVCNMDLDHLKFYVVCINGRRYVCCSECYVVSNECGEHTSWLQTIHTTSGGPVTADTNCCANCVETFSLQQWEPDLPFLG